MIDYNALTEQLIGLVEGFSREAPHRMLQEYSKGEVFLLNFLFSRGGTARPGEMSAAMEASTARVAAAINSMQRKGWVRREVDAYDHRKALVHLTPQGNAYVMKCREGVHGRVIRLLMALGPEEAVEYVGLISRLTELHEHARRQMEMKG